MKLSNKIFIGLAAVSSLIGFSSCTEAQLTAAPEDAIVTEDQKDATIAISPEKLAAGVNGIYAWMLEFNTNGYEDHDDFGYPAFALASELWGQDMYMTGNGYGWFWYDQGYLNRSYTDRAMYFHWNLFYQMIKKANDVIVSVDADTEDPALLAYTGQAKAMRAFAYLHLVQIYQHTYKGHEQAPAVPISTEKTDIAAAANNPRATVAKVYEQILGDLKDALVDLDGYRRKLKVEVNEAVVYGLLARTYLNMEEWDLAAEAAQNALDYSGATPMSPDEYADAEMLFGSFSDISNHSWMWGCKMEESNEAVTTGICNYPSHLVSWTYGYAVAGSMYKAISKSLYDEISDTDIRKDPMVFCGEDGMEDMGFPPYTNTKFKPYKGVIMTDVNANDWPLMRAEEMILIKAEAQAMGSAGPAAGATTLTDFVKKYRDPSYTCTATTNTGVQDAVWIQRRIELWGEGFAWFDLKRLKKPSIRKYEGTNCLEDGQFNLSPEHGMFLLRIPLKEIQSNNGISEGDNNPIATPN